MKLDKSMLTLYAITDRAWSGSRSLYEQVEAALKGGVTVVQLREKELCEEAFLEEAIQLGALCRRYGAVFIINDNVQLALRCKADGVHVGLDDMPVTHIRAMAGDDFIIGATAKTVEQAVRAQNEGADYLGVGAVFPSPTKTNALRITKEKLRSIVSSVEIPCVAIGGITLDNAKELAGSGVSGIAVISSLFGAQDIEARAKQLKRAAREIINES